MIAFALFIQGAAWNANVVRVEQAPYCPYLKDGVFAGAAVLALAATALSITSFIMQRTQPAAAATVTGASAVGTPNMPGAGAGGQQSPSPEVVMGQPLFPSGKAHQNDYPVKPQGYEHEQQPHQVQVQQVPPPTDSHHHPRTHHKATHSPLLKATCPTRQTTSSLRAQPQRQQPQHRRRSQRQPQPRHRPCCSRRSGRSPWASRCRCRSRHSTAFLSRHLRSGAWTFLPLSPLLLLLLRRQGAGRRCRRLSATK